MANWWGTRRNVSARLVAEVEAMKSAFDDTFKLVVPPGDGIIYWEGTVQVNLRFLSYPYHDLKILYPSAYPNKPAEAFCTSPPIEANNHQWTDGRLCLFNPKDGEQYGWNPARSTAVSVAGWAIEWLYAYHIWRQTKKWPGIEEDIIVTKSPRRA